MTAPNWLSDSKAALTARVCFEALLSIDRFSGEAKIFGFAIQSAGFAEGRGVYPESHRGIQLAWASDIGVLMRVNRNSGLYLLN